MPAKTILVVTHVDPDGDAIGSLTAMGQLLMQIGKEVILANDDPAPPELAYLPLFDKLVHPDDKSSEGKPWLADLIIALDCGDASRMGKSGRHFAGAKPPIVNIDHHRTNDNFGDVNLVDAKATSTAEIIYHLMPAMSVKLTEAIAESLLTGIITDTLAFRIPGVTAQTIATASELMAAGADLSKITDAALNVQPYRALQLMRVGLNNMQFLDGLLWTTLAQAELFEIGLTEPSTGALASMLGNVHEAAMGCVMTELPDGRINFSFRARLPWDVSVVAEIFDGGGHQLAAGCTIDGPLAKAEAMIVACALSVIAEQRQP